MQSLYGSRRYSPKLNLHMLQSPSVTAGLYTSMRILHHGRIHRSSLFNEAYSHLSQNLCIKY